MPISSFVLPPSLVLSPAMVYAIQGNVYALEINSGTLRQNYPIQDIAYPVPAVEEDVLYLCMIRQHGSTIQALRSSDSTPLWSYQVEGHLAGAPVIAGGVVYISRTRGTIYALNASDGTLLWQYTLDRDPGIASSYGPFFSVSPIIAGEVLYITSTVNTPLHPFLYAFQANTGTLLWHTPIPDSTHYPLTAADGVLYLSTSFGCIALRASDASAIWQYETSEIQSHGVELKNLPDGSAVWLHKSPAQVCSPPVIAHGMIYLILSVTAHDMPDFPSSPRRWGKALLCALRASDGSFLWCQQIGTETVDTEGGNLPTPPVVTHDTISLGADDGYLYAFQAGDGAPLWRYKTGGSRLSSPAGANGVVYVGADDGYVYALRASDGALLWRTFVSVAATASIGAFVSPGRRVLREADPSEVDSLVMLIRLLLFVKLGNALLKLIIKMSHICHINGVSI